MPHLTWCCSFWHAVVPAMDPVAFMVKCFCMSRDSDVIYHGIKERVFLIYSVPAISLYITLHFSLLSPITHHFLFILLFFICSCFDFFSIFYFIFSPLLLFSEISVKQELFLPIYTPRCTKRQITFTTQKTSATWEKYFGKSK